MHARADARQGLVIKQYFRRTREEMRACVVPAQLQMTGVAMRHAEITVLLSNDALQHVNNEEGTINYAEGELNVSSSAR